ncbi:MAG: 4Fe-4S binding protein [Gammaproteobacteria bacterium]|nr:4Fe-4S binding protein [Gammaproteobacteria bacterium]
MPLAVHDVGSVGLEAWFAALASGVARVLLLFAPSDPRAKRETTASQIGVARALLDALGHSAERASMIFTDQEFGLIGDELPALVGQPVENLGGRDKRSILQRALQYLAAANDVPATVTALPPGAPFGNLDVDPDACTLCMSCVSACPRDALLGHNGGRLGIARKPVRAVWPLRQNLPRTGDRAGTPLRDRRLA